MTRKTFKILVDEVYSKLPEKNYTTNKTDVYYIDDIRSLDILDFKDYGPENSRGSRYVLVVIDKFSKFGFTTASKNENAQTIKDFYEIILTSSNKKSKLVEIYRGKEFYNIILISSNRKSKLIESYWGKEFYKIIFQKF